MEHYRLYHADLPAFLAALAETPSLRRLGQVGMNCGCEYTSFPLFTGLAPYSRLDHSLGVGLIVWHFTGDPAQAAAGLLHDAATPVFAHVVDFLRGDHLRQETTEAGTRETILADRALLAELTRQGLTVEEVADYHRYPIADNDAPRLSADRLEYTLGNLINYRLVPEAAVRAFYEDLCVGENEEGIPELCFQSRRTAERFARAALLASEIYVADEDRLAMQTLAELLGAAIRRGVLTEADLMTTEPPVIEKLLRDPASAAAWRGFCALSRVETAPAPRGPDWRRVAAKKRAIDPLVRGEGRLSALCPGFASALAAFYARSQDVWLHGI